MGGDLGQFLASLISRRAKPLLAYLGPEKSFTWEAASTYMPDAKLVAARTISEVFQLVEDGSADLGVVPFMNSLEGPVGETVDSLAMRRAHIAAVLEMRIVLCFAKKGTPKVVYSHPHAIAQARRFVSSLGAQVVYTNSTAEAVRSFESCQDCGVLASPKALQGVEAQCGVEDAESYTRFAVLTRSEPSRGRYASLIFAVPNVAGALYKALAPIADAGINMTLIYSRPTRLSPWDYFFLAELEIGDGLAELMEALRPRTTLLKVVGRYDVVRI
ncbi:MAG: prephenate dehydratase domain-containing protein [Thermoproteus sp.]